MKLQNVIMCILNKVVLFLFCFLTLGLTVNQCTGPYSLNGIISL